MQPFEYLLLFAVIVLGLGVGDLAASLQRLLAAGKLVKWDWLAPLAGLVAFLMTVTEWWNWFGLESLAGDLTYPMFLAVLTSSLLLFLLCASALPDDFGDRPIDLRAYYASVSRRYWLLFLAQRGVAYGTGVWAWVTIGNARLAQLQLAWVSMPVALLLVFVRNRWWQGFGLVVVAVLFAGPHVGQTLTH